MVPTQNLLHYNEYFVRSLDDFIQVLLLATVTSDF